MTVFSTTRKFFAAAAMAGSLALASVGVEAQEMTLRGASLFDNEHAYSKTLIRFGELVNEYYDGDVTFDLRGNSELGIEPLFVLLL